MNANIIVNPTANHATIDRFENVHAYITRNNGDIIDYPNVNVEVINGETINIYSRVPFEVDRCIHCFIENSYRTIEIF